MRDKYKRPSTTERLQFGIAVICLITVIAIVIYTLTGCTSTGACVFPPHYDLCGFPSDDVRDAGP